MAQAVQGGIIDLTGEDDSDNSISMARSAWEKAFEAASRLTNHFESLATYKSPTEYVNPTNPSEESHLPAIAPKELVPPRLGTFSNPTRSEANGLKKDEKDNAMPREDSRLPSSDVSFIRSSPGTAASKSADSPSTIQGAKGNKQQPEETKPMPPGADTSTVRMPRSAALSAKQNIAETCNKLENWAKKDPKLIPQQAGVNAPRKSGRPKKDPDEWSPGWSTKNILEERKGLSRIMTNSSTPSVGKHGDLIADENKSSSAIKGISTSLGTKKRKVSRSSLSHDSPVKMAKRSEDLSAHPESAPQNLAELADKKYVYDGTGDNPSAGCFPECVHHAIKAAKADYVQSLTEDELIGIGKSIINDIMERGVEAFCPASADCSEVRRTELISNSVSEKFHERTRRVRNGLPINLITSAEYSPKGTSAPPFKHDLEASPLEHVPSSKSTVKMDSMSLSKSSTAECGKNGGSTKTTMLHTQEKIDPGLQQGLHEASDPTASEPDMYSAPTGRAVFIALFKSIVYPAMKKSKRRHEGTLPSEDLDVIGKTIVNEVVQKLASHPEDPYQLDEDTKKKIKRFVKKSFRQKVRKANAQSSHNSATPANDSRLYEATLSSGSSGLEGTTGGQTVHGGHVPHASSLNHAKRVSSSRAIAVNEMEEAQALRQSHPRPVGQQQSVTSQTLPNESPISPFGPGFDRGRYPALRRRRANKNYTPARTADTTHMLTHNRFEAFDDHLRSQAVTGLSTDPTLTVPASNQHNPDLEVSNGEDQVGLLKASANQPTTTHASQMQPRALTTAAEKKRTPTDQRSAVELLASIEGPTDLGPVTPNSVGDSDISRSQREASAQGQRRVTVVGEAPAGGRGPVFPRLAKSRSRTAKSPSAQQAPRKRSLEDTGPPQESRPTFRPKPATALDPNFEHMVAVLVTDTPSRSTRDGQRYSITPKTQKQLVTDRSMVKHVDFAPEDGKPNFVRVETKVIDPVRQPGRCFSSLLRNRELGLSSRGRRVGTIGELRQLKSEMIEPWKDWKGASGDVVTVAWSPDSNVYAFGAAAHTNIEDIQYNRPCNLLLGNLNSNQIKELPDHRIDRPKPQAIPNGPNATQAVYDACDPNVYETVTSIAFSSTGDRMYTASHDCTVKIWDVAAGKHECLSTFRHEAWVTSMEVSEQRHCLFATASKCVKDAVRIYYSPEDPEAYVNFSASRAETRPDWKIYPECLRWGPNPHNSHLLLAGFQQWEQRRDLLLGGGQLCLWDAHALESIKVAPSSQSVYAAAWHPTQPYFATGGAPGNNIVDKTVTKTVVRTWDVRVPKRFQIEYECAAIDMQDITFSPLDSNVVTAGCTDGISYVWDWRWPDRPLHRLKHGSPLVELDHTREREEADTGVMLSLWGPGGSLFYTGSSDGIIKAWDVRRHPKDVLIRDVAKFDVSIQSGAFSPDGNNLLVGDAEGGIHVLSSAPCGPRSNVQSTDAYIDLVRASDGSGRSLDPNDDDPGTEGIEAAKALVESGQLEYHKELGVGQGLNYKGPYAAYARKEATESSVGRLRKKFEKTQPISKKGVKRWDIAIPMTSLLHERKELMDREKDGKKLALEGPDGHGSKAIQRSKAPAGGSVGATVAGGREDRRVEDDMISESEMVEENYWWDRMGEEEIERARAGRVRC